MSLSPYIPDCQPGPYVCLTIRDTGHGMRPEILDHIFDPFFTTKGVGEGSGMGLAMVHGTVTNHGGAITVESAPGVGTLFKIYLPRTAQRAPQTRASRSARLRRTRPHFASR